MPECQWICFDAFQEKLLCCAGASGSGKSTFTDRLKKVMNTVVVLSMDMYNDGSKVLEVHADRSGLLLCLNAHVSGHVFQQCSAAYLLIN